MTEVPHSIERRFLKSETLRALRNEIARGTWTDKLPSERYLTETFAVSRGTLRVALKILADEKIIESIAKHGHYIRKRPALGDNEKKATSSIGLLIGDPETQIPARRLAWLPPLQSRLSQQGLRVHVHEAIPEMARTPTNALKKLLQVTHHRCWLLVRCGQETQSFFQENELPAILCGTPFPGIDLPYVDIDFRAVVRHAVGVLASRGHSHIGFVTSKATMPGDLASLEGFKRGIAESSRPLSSQVIRYPEPNYSFASLISRIAKMSSPATALIVDSPLQTVSIATRAMQRGIRLPKQLTIVCRDYAEYLEYIHPTPGFYLYEPKIVARKIESRILARLQGDKMKGQGTLVIPDFKG